MRGVLNYTKGYLVLFFMLMILTQAAAGGKYQKYISFFSQMILVLGLLYPLLNWAGKTEFIRDQVEYEAFWQKLEEIRLDAEKITYQDQETYVKKYEDAIAFDMTQMAESYHFAVKEIEVTMTENYEISKVSMTVTDPEKENLVIGEITWGETGTEQRKGQADGDYRKLRERLLGYYKLSEEQLDIIYEG